MAATMRITIFTFGSRGDTQPYLALAVGLQQAGHYVTLVASRDIAEWIRSYGVNVHPLRLSMQELAQKLEHGYALRGRNVVGYLRALRSVSETLMAGM